MMMMIIGEGTNKRMITEIKVEEVSSTFSKPRFPLSAKTAFRRGERMGNSQQFSSVQVNAFAWLPSSFLASTSTRRRRRLVFVIWGNSLFFCSTELFDSSGRRRRRHASGARHYCVAFFRPSHGVALPSSPPLTKLNLKLLSSLTHIGKCRRSLRSSLFLRPGQEPIEVRFLFSILLRAANT